MEWTSSFVKRPQDETPIGFNITYSAAAANVTSCDGLVVAYTEVSRSAARYIAAFQLVAQSHA